MIFPWRLRPRVWSCFGIWDLFWYQIIFGTLGDWGSWWWRDKPVNRTYTATLIDVTSIYVVYATPYKCVQWITCRHSPANLQKCVTSCPRYRKTRPKKLDRFLTEDRLDELGLRYWTRCRKGGKMGERSKDIRRYMHTHKQYNVHPSSCIPLSPPHNYWTDPQLCSSFGHTTHIFETSK